MANATLLHIGTRQGLGVATKPGTSPDWRLTRRALDGRPVTALALGAEFPLRLLAALAGAGVFYSRTSGRTWEETLSQPVAVLLPDPQDADRIYAAPAATAPAGAPVADLQVSDDGGLTWRAAPDWPADAAGVRSLAAVGGTLWAGLVAGGVLYAPADAASWTVVAGGLAGQGAVQAFAVGGGEPPDLFAATASGLFHLAPAPALGGPLDPGARWLVIPDAPRDLRGLLPVGRGAAALLAVDGVGGLWGGTQAGAVWTALALPTAATALAAHPEYPDRAYAGTRDGRVYETRNRGATWTDTGLAAGAEVLCLAVAELK